MNSIDSNPISSEVLLDSTSNLIDDNLIKVGSQVIVYSSREQIDSIIIKSGGEFQSRFGHFKHDQMVNLSFGSKYSSSNKRGFVYLLKPTPELWTLALPHRTQILYSPDISFITSFLDIKAGSKVIEAGTGSGSFSHSIARSVGTKGKVYSFEYHEERFIKAKAEFESHGLDEVITLKHQNVCKDGFEIVDEVDSVFLDVPAPWEALASAKIALRKDRQSRVCCFSPCIEQVLRTVSALSEFGFTDITMYETLTRTHDPAQYTNLPISNAIERIQAVEEKKGKRRDAQINDAKNKKITRELKRKREEVKKNVVEGEEVSVAGEKAIAVKVEEEEDVEEGPAKKKIALEIEKVIKVEEIKVKVEESELIPEDIEMNSLPLPLPISITTSIPSSSNNVSRTTTPLPKQFTFKASAQSRGHTSYLTFATLLPIASLLPNPSSLLPVPTESNITSAEEEVAEL